VLAVTGVVVWVHRFGTESGRTTLVAQAAGSPSRADLDRTAAALAKRAAAARFSGVRTSVKGTRVELSVAGHHAAALRALALSGRLVMRRVVASLPDDHGGAPKAEPVAEPTAGAAERRTAIAVQLGRAYELARQLTAPEQSAAEPALEPFGQLSPEEVDALPVELQYNLTQITCRQLNARPLGGGPEAAPDAEVDCDRGDGPRTKYKLGAIGLSSVDLAAAKASASPTGGWLVTVSFTRAGQEKFTELTRALYGSGTDPQLLAIVVDHEVVSAPQIQGVISGDAQITGSFDRAAATGLAARLSGGALPVDLTVVAVRD
jgi:preprotein translocase subunit SecD